MPYTDDQASRALLDVIGSSRWEAVGIAHGFCALQNGAPNEEAARAIYRHGSQSLKKSREIVDAFAKSGFLTQLTLREERGAAADVVPKLFPGRITEERFLELLDDLKAQRKGLDYLDHRGTEHGLGDFTINEGGYSLPVNVKVASTQFRRAAQLVQLDPADCIPIPAYKANAAIEKHPNMLYAVSVDYSLIGILASHMPKSLSTDEAIVWDLIGKYQGTLARDAEDIFVFEIVRKYWDTLKPLVKANPFHIISARKAVRILQTRPERTPGIGMRGWGTGASAEVNVHVSVQQDTTSWDTVAARIVQNGIVDIIGAVNRKRVEEVFDPEI